MHDTLKEGILSPGVPVGHGVVNPVPSEPGIGMEPVMWSRIAVSVDFSDISRHVLETGIELAGKFGAELHVLTVVNDETEWSISVGDDKAHVKEKWREELKNEGFKRLEEFLASVPGGDVEPKPVVLLGEVVEQVREYCMNEKMELLVIGSHGDSGFVSDWLGGVAYWLTKRAGCPVLVVR